MCLIELSEPTAKQISNKDLTQTTNLVKYIFTRTLESRLLYVQFYMSRLFSVWLVAFILFTTATLPYDFAIDLSRPSFRTVTRFLSKRSNYTIWLAVTRVWLQITNLKMRCSLRRIATCFKGNRILCSNVPFTI